MYRRILAALAVWLPFALVASLLWPVLEVGSAPMLAPTPESVADLHYAGFEAKAAKRFAAAAESFRRALEDRPTFRKPGTTWGSRSVKPADTRTPSRPTIGP